MSNKGEYNWPLVAVLALILGVPAFFRVQIDFGVVSGLLVSGLLMGVYIGLVQLFGHGSAIEAWIALLMVLILIFIFSPMFARSHATKLKGPGYVRTRS